MRFDANSADVRRIEKKTDPLHKLLAHVTLMVTRRGRILVGALSLSSGQNQSAQSHVRSGWKADGFHHEEHEGTRRTECDELSNRVIGCAIGSTGNLDRVCWSQRISNARRTS